MSCSSTFLTISYFIPGEDSDQAVVHAVSLCLVLIVYKYSDQWADFGHHWAYIILLLAFVPKIFRILLTQLCIFSVHALP